MFHALVSVSYVFVPELGFAYCVLLSFFLWLRVVRLIVLRLLVSVD